MKAEPGAARTRLGRLAGERGITLLETLFSLSLFALSVATMSNFIVTQIRSSNTNDNYTIAYELAVQELEDVRAQLYDQMESRSRDYEVGGMTFEVETNVEADEPAANMKTIDVDITWNEPAGERNVALQTIYTAVTR
jgi:Tfp pilus assembly protein PilV